MHFQTHKDVLTNLGASGLITASKETFYNKETFCNKEKKNASSQ